MSILSPVTSSPVSVPVPMKNGSDSPPVSAPEKAAKKAKKVRAPRVKVGDLKKRISELEAEVASLTATSAAPTNYATYAADQVITVLRELNPKRSGGKAYFRFESYLDGMTVAEALATPQGPGKLRQGDFRADVRDGHISIA